jgi:hypothetical protein
MYNEYFALCLECESSKPYNKTLHEKYYGFKRYCQGAL